MGEPRIQVDQTLRLHQDTSLLFLTSNGLFQLLRCLNNKATTLSYLLKSDHSNS